MNQEDKRRPQRHLREALLLPGVWLLCLVYFSVAVGTNGMGGFFLPSYIKYLYPGAEEGRIGFLSAIPSIAAVCGMILFGWNSDRTKERRWHIAVAAFIGALGMVLSVSVESPDLALAAMALSYLGMYSMLPTFWALATHNITGVGAAGAIALINSLANFGGFLAPTVVGAIKKQTGSFTGGAWFMAGALLMGSVLVLYARHDAKLEQK